MSNIKTKMTPLQRALVRQFCSDWSYGFKLIEGKVMLGNGIDPIVTATIPIEAVTKRIGLEDVTLVSDKEGIRLYKLMT